MSAFTVIVQNQYPTHRLGEVTAGLQFFRSLGSTVGLAVFGTILNSRFASALAGNLPAQLHGMAADPATAGLINNPQVLLSADAQSKLQQAFGQFGADGQKLFASFMDAVRHSLGSALASVFFVGMGIAAAGFVVVLFLKEVRLRRTLSEALETGEGAMEAEAGTALLGEVDEPAAASEPVTAAE